MRVTQRLGRVEGMAPTHGRTSERRAERFAAVSVRAHVAAGTTAARRRGTADFHRPYLFRMVMSRGHTHRGCVQPVVRFLNSATGIPGCRCPRTCGASDAMYSASSHLHAAVRVAAITASETRPPVGARRPPSGDPSSCCGSGSTRTSSSRSKRHAKGGQCRPPCSRRRRPASESTPRP